MNAIKAFPGIWIWALILIAHLLITTSGCRTWHVSDTRITGFGFAGGATFDPDEFLDALNPGISLRASSYYNPSSVYSVRPGGTWPIKYGRPYQRFQIVAGPPAGLETIAVFWGLGGDASTPIRAAPCGPGRLCKYQFTVTNDRTGDVTLTIRAEFGVRFQNGQAEVHEEGIQQYNLHFATSRWDHFISSG